MLAIVRETSSCTDRSAEPSTCAGFAVTVTVIGSSPSFGIVVIRGQVVGLGLVVLDREYIWGVVGIHGEGSISHLRPN